MSRGRDRQSNNKPRLRGKREPVNIRSSSTRKSNQRDESKSRRNEILPGRSSLEVHIKFMMIYSTFILRRYIRTAKGLRIFRDKIISG